LPSARALGFVPVERAGYLSMPTRAVNCFFASPISTFYGFVSACCRPICWLVANTSTLPPKTRARLRKPVSRSRSYRVPVKKPATTDGHRHSYGRLLLNRLPPQPSRRTRKYSISANTVKRGALEMGFSLNPEYIATCARVRNGRYAFSHHARLTPQEALPAGATAHVSRKIPFKIRWLRQWQTPAARPRT